VETLPQPRLFRNHITSTQQPTTTHHHSTTRYYYNSPPPQPRERTLPSLPATPLQATKLKQCPTQVAKPLACGARGRPSTRWSPTAYVFRLLPRQRKVANARLGLRDFGRRVQHSAFGVPGALLRQRRTSAAQIAQFLCQPLGAHA
jgi:hypothetical protein